MNKLVKWSVGLFAIVTSWGLLTSCTASSPVNLDSTLSLETDDGRILEVEAHTLEVPENRHRADSRTINIGYWVVRSENPDAGDPIFLLAGGPGGSFPERLMEGGQRQVESLRLIDIYSNSGDVVMADLRGINLSTPNLDCDGPKRKLRRTRTQEDWDALLTSAASACRQKLIGEGFDLDGYRAEEAARDIAEVADALGYDNIRLAGHSFGSFWALTTAKYHGDRISALVLSGVEGLDQTLDDPEQTELTLEKLSELATERWNGRHGFSSPMAVLEALYNQSFARSKWASHEVVALALSGPEYSLTHRNGMQGWLDAVDAMARRRPLSFGFVQWVAGFDPALTGWDFAAVGLFDCSSWASDERLQRVRNHSSSMYREMSLSYYEAICSGWNVNRVPDEFYTFRSSTIPTLVIHGDLDVSTPFANAKDLMSIFNDIDIVLVENGSHHALHEALEHRADFQDDIVKWLKDRTVPPTTISLPSPDFVK